MHGNLSARRCPWANDGVTRRRRTREETREILLAAAVRLLEARVAGDDGASVNPLADVLFTDVLEEANRGENSTGAP